MYSDNFEKSIEFVLKAEGGYVNNPNDPGGETNFGISKRMYKRLDIKNLTVDQAKEIYHKDYWSYMKCEDLEWPLCLVHFDTGVNCGYGTAKNIYGNSNNDVEEYLRRREGYYNSRTQRLKTQFLKGWLNRLKLLRKYIKEEA